MYNRKEFSINLGTWAAAIDEKGDIWFSCYEFNGLFSFDTYNNRIEHKGTFPRTPLDIKEQHGAAFYCSGKIVFTPLISSFIHVVDIDSNDIRSYFIDGDGEFVSRPLMLGSKVYIVNAKKIMSFSVNDETLSLEAEYTEICKDYFADEDIQAYPYNTGFVMRGCSSNRYLRIDFVNGERAELMLNPPGLSVVRSVQYYNDEYWILGDSSSSVISYNWNAKEYTIYSLVDENNTLDERDFPYFLIVFSVTGKWLINYYANSLRLINQAERKIENVRYYQDNVSFFNSVGYGAAIGCVVETEQNIYFFPQRGKQLFIYDKKSNMFKKQDFSISIVNIMNYNSIIDCKLKDKGIIDEYEFGLEAYVRYASRMELT